MGIYARDSGVWKNVSGGDPSSPAIVSGGTVSTYTDSGITYQVNTFTSDGTLSVSSEGVAEPNITGTPFRFARTIIKSLAEYWKPLCCL